MTEGGSWLLAWAGDEGSAHLEVTASGAAADAVHAQVGALVDERFASRLFARDATLWGTDAEREAGVRLSWVDLARSSRHLVGEVAALREELGAELDHVVLCGMGGSSLAPEVICATAGVPLTVLDSSDPDSVRAALGDRLERTVVVVSSKSGGTLETDSQRRAYEQAFADAGIDPTQRVIVVTDPGSPLEAAARQAGYRVVVADPHVGGRYSALTAFGLVPSGLAGVDVGALLDDAEAVADLLSEDAEANPGLVLGAALAGLPRGVRDKVLLAQDGSGIPGFADWAEQLVAESTGKLGRGLLPVVVEGPLAPEMHWSAPDVLPVRLVSGSSDEGSDHAGSDHGDSDDRADAPFAAQAGDPALAPPRSPSPARSGPSCCCGRSRRWSPADCSPSTRSTSPTSRAPSWPPAACSTPPPVTSQRSSSTASRCVARPVCWTTSPTSRGPWPHCWAGWTPSAATSP